MTGGKGDGKGKDKGGEGRDERGNVTGQKQILKKKTTNTFGLDHEG